MGIAIGGVPRGDAGDLDSLNPMLERSLRRLGAVKLANEGQEMVLGAPVRDAATGRYEPNVAYPGEYLRICCPYCDDTNFHLWVNHRYGTVDKATGRTFSWLAICYKDDCLADLDNRRDFEERVFGFLNRNCRYVDAVQIKPGVKVDVPLGRVPLPGECTRVDRLPAGHPAVRYLAGRGYDVAELGATYKVRHCARSDDYPMARNRIIVPVYHDGERVGWQARYVGDPDFKATGVTKYFTMPGFRRSRVLYNFDRARRGRVVVLTEGVADAWRVGPAAGVALLGKTLSADQARLLEDWGGRSRANRVVVALDGDAAEAADAVVARLAATLRHRVARLSLPPGRDPGLYDRDALLRLIEFAVADAAER